MITQTLRLETIDANSPLLRDVKDLGRMHSSTLGFFPNGAFDDHAKRKWIIVAVDQPTGRCLGYLLYRCTDNRVTVVHLCVASESRGRGVAKKLVECLVSTTTQMLGIGLRCRRDYQANDLWPSLGFTALSEKVGRSRDGKELVFWWRDHGHPTLFSHSIDTVLSTKIPVVIDKNVFIDLHYQNRPESEESCSLLADWLSDIELCITDELLNEIARDDDGQRRQQQRGLASGYVQMRCPNEDFERAHAILRPLFPEKMSKQDNSDLRHLSMAVGAGAKFFVSRDDALLRKTDDVYASCQLLIMRPADIITHFDQVLREEHYQPSRLAGTRIQREHAVTGSESELARAFRADDTETKTGFLSSVRRLLADPRTHECVIVRNQAGELLSFLVLSRMNDKLLDIPVFRVSRQPLARTLARYMLFDCVIRSSGEFRLATRITDPHISKTVRDVLSEEMFSAGSLGWIKMNPRFVGTAQDLQRVLPDLLSILPPEYTELNQLISIVRQVGSQDDATVVAYIEQLLWPAKIVDGSLPTFIVPIKPVWAQHLFDENLARQNLFGANIELALQKESAYYRCKNASRGIAAPARILWYVSQDRQCLGAGCIRACSYLDEVHVGSAKETYKRFRRYGVYTRSDLLRLTGGDLSKEVMVLRFRDTELLVNPVPWGSDLWEMLGKKDTMQSPVRITADAFHKLYSYTFPKVLS